MGYVGTAHEIAISLNSKDKLYHLHGICGVFQRPAKVDSTLRDNTERVLRASGVIVPVSDASEGQIRVVVNNIADRGAAAAKGFGTGLTFGLVGTTVTDAYEMAVAITAKGKTVERVAVKHALHTAIGNTAIPEGLETMPPNAAFERVLEQMVLRVLQDIQSKGELS